ncbi:ABC transporter [Methanobrevibacter sp. YE315]|uniref:ABC transporter permease n=1 Tax=Methanobrevibacter sp. YE315 TaxID=1609968 RepID=UPI000764F07B|nr:ABC transporter permease [Methanobrevibacter sp. YE315]AMD18273.1 ABC transporter [Methanobrevibacter sp. YE315]
MFDTFSEKKFLLKQLVKRDLTSKYKDSVLGILWSFFNPLLIMLVFTAIFSMLFGRQIENYPVYFLSGRLIYDFYNAGTKGAMRSIKRNAALLKKIYVPKHMFSISAICYEFVNFLISFVILFGVMLITGAKFHPTIIFAIIPIMFLVCLIFGIGLILAVCNTYFSDIGHLYNVFTLVLMYASALFYPMEIVPALVQKIFTLNPVYSAITCFRECVVYGITPNLSTLSYLAAFSLTVLGIGILLFNIYDKKLALEI